MRLKVDERGQLVDREGAVLGKLVSLTVDLDLGVRGEISDLERTSEPSVNAQESLLPQGGAGDERKDDVKIVWEHYQNAIPTGKQYTLEAKRRSIIRNALKVRPMSTVLRAIDGLAASPHHNGQNDRRKKYLGINYALQGIGAQSNDERIDDMASKAAATVDGVLANIPSAGRAMVRDRQRQVEDMLLHPGDENRRARGVGSEKYLAEQFGLHARTDGQGGVIWERKA